MDKLKRRVFFWTLVVLFLIITPLIVLNATGYRFDRSRGVFVYSGAIMIKSNPQAINVALNGDFSQTKKLNRINNAYNITGLLPSDYEVKVTMDGFQSWVKKSDVHSGISSEFWNVLLVRNEYKKVIYDSTSGIDKFYISPRNRYIAYTENSSEGLKVSIYNIASKKTEQSFLLSGWQLLDSSKRENIEWSPQEDYLSVPVQKDVAPSVIAKKKVGQQDVPDKEYFYIIIDPNKKTTADLTDIIANKSIEDVRWDPQNKDYLFYLSQNSLFRANINDKADINLIAQGVASFDLSKSRVDYVQSPNNLIFSSNLDGTSDRNQLTSDYPGDPSKNIERLIIYDDSRIAMIDSDKNLFVFNEGGHGKYFRKLGEDVEGVHFSDDGKKLLYWTNNEISAYFLRDWQVQPIRSENDVTNVTRYSEPIGNVQWFKDYEHVIFNTGRWVKVIELDPRDHRNCMDLTNTTTENPFIRYNNSLEILFFTEKNGDSNTLQSIIFPEPVPLLGIGGGATN